jgi:2-polyprenyl-6-methoxyphenol hydroxylase-like FAD-dependent oxidoreductase
MQLRGMRVVVVGGSLSGLAAAIAFRAGGANVIVVERRQTFEDQGATIALRPDALTALTSLGVAVQGAQSRGWRYVAMVDGAPRVRLERNVPVTAYTYAALRARADGIDLRLGAEVTEIDPAAGRVRLAGEAIDADLIVAADGVDSLARRLLWPELAPLHRSKVKTRGWMGRVRQLRRPLPRAREARPDVHPP